MNKQNDNIVEEFLKHRDLRVEYQKKLIEKYKKPIICLRVNYPGINKNNSTTKKINEIILNILVELLTDKIVLNNSYTSLEGPVSILVINDDPYELKKTCMNIEEKHCLGRLVDIDVYDENYFGLSRTDLGAGKRKCYLCNDLAFACARTNKHSLSEIISFIENSVNNYCNNLLSVDYTNTH